MGGGGGGGVNGSFVELQSIPTNGAYWWEAFTIDGVQHLVVANSYKPASFDIDSDSVIYKWKSELHLFMVFQKLPTSAARGWYAFAIEGVQHLAVAGADSTIYKWSSAIDEFEVIQAIPTVGARSWAGFVSDGVQHLVVANHFDWVSGSFYQDSKIYRWDSGDSSFLEIQKIPTFGAHGASALMIDGVQYLALASFRDDISYNVDSSIYRWGTSTTTSTTGTITSTSATRTSSTSSSTRTEAPSTLEATEFAFADIGAWSLAALGGYLAAGPCRC